MSFSTHRVIASLLVTTAMGLGSIGSAYAQQINAPAADDSAMKAPPAANMSKPSRAERKVARKENRAKKNAELKKLEQNGYTPGENDPHYPQNLQNAQKKAGIQ